MGIAQAYTTHLGFRRWPRATGLLRPKDMKSGERRFTDAAINVIYKQEAGLKVNSRFGGGGTTAAAGGGTHFFKRVCHWVNVDYCHQ
jgi:hypothetical protein